MVSPAISIIDKAIISNAAGTDPLLSSIKKSLKHMITSPVAFLKQPSVLLIWFVYAGTYITGNCIERLSIHWNKEPFYPKFLASSATNVTLSVAKDRVFARMFGKGPIRPLPYPSYLLFGARDSLTILAGFSLPPLISQYSQKYTTSNYDTLIQLSVPCLMQFISTPMHLLGLDLYNRPEGNRVEFIRKEYWKTSFARISRIFPAYGIGGVVNKKLRKQFVDQH
ncbi:hypothetical protein MP638_002434 [Amoeboaphelidium occidentale]|nr:hypothetical protein MP638_002434 [Amoeboaphelidium occidentale]